MTAASINAQTVMWTDDPEHTRIGFEVEHAGLSFVSGYFSDFDITVRQKNGDCTNTDIRGGSPDGKCEHRSGSQK